MAAECVHRGRLASPPAVWCSGHHGEPCSEERPCGACRQIRNGDPAPLRANTPGQWRLWAR